MDKDFIYLGIYMFVCIYRGNEKQLESSTIFVSGQAVLRQEWYKTGTGSLCPRSHSSGFEGLEDHPGRRQHSGGQNR